MSYRGSSPTERNSILNHSQDPRTTNLLKSRWLNSKQGEFLQPKHLILTDFKVLRPMTKIPPTIPIFNLHDTLPKNVLRKHIDEVEIPDIDLYNYPEVTLSRFLND